jgi:hypothetical protein
MTKEQRKVYKQYLGTSGPGAGSLKTAFLRGQAGTRNVYLKTSLAWAAWKAGRDTPLPDGVTARDIALKILPRSISS